MKRLILIALALTVVTAEPFARTQTQPTQRSVAATGPIRSMLDTYCITCHSSAVRAGNVAFAGMSLDAIGENAEIWEKTVRKMRGHLMPPPGSRQPSQAEVDAFIGSLENALDQLFGEGDTAEDRDAISRQNVSLLDRINERTRALQRELDPGDRVILDSYLSTVREIERRIERASHRDLSDIKLPAAPIGTLDSFDEQVRLIFD